MIFSQEGFPLFLYEMNFWSNANMKNEKEIPVKDGTPEFGSSAIFEKKRWFGLEFWLVSPALYE